MAHESPPLAPQACSDPQANRKDRDSHHDSLILPGHVACVLHARIVVGILVGVHVHIVVVLSQGIRMSTLRLWSRWPQRRSFFQMSTIRFVCWRRLRLVRFSPSSLPMTLLPLAGLVQLPCEEPFLLLQSSSGPLELPYDLRNQSWLLLTVFQGCPFVALVCPTGRAGVALGPASFFKEHTPVRHARTFIIIVSEGKPQLVISWRAVLSTQF